MKMGETRGPKHLSFLLRGGLVVKPCSGSGTEFWESCVKCGREGKKDINRRIDRDWRNSKREGKGEREGGEEGEKGGGKGRGGGRID